MGLEDVMADTNEFDSINSEVLAQMEKANYETSQPSMGIGRLRTPPVRKILEAQIKEFEAHIKVRVDLIKKLDENKNVEDILDALRKIGI